jgi:hypothetical protein
VEGRWRVGGGASVVRARPHILGYNNIRSINDCYTRRRRVIRGMVWGGGGVGGAGGGTARRKRWGPPGRRDHQPGKEGSGSDVSIADPVRRCCVCCGLAVSGGGGGSGGGGVSGVEGARARARLSLSASASEQPTRMVSGGVLGEQG